MSILILSSHLGLGLPNGLFPSGFPTNTLCTPLSSPIRTTCPAHLILLDFTTRTILGKEYRSLGKEYRSLGKEYKSLGKEYRSLGKEYRLLGKEYRSFSSSLCPF